MVPINFEILMHLISHSPVDYIVKFSLSGIGADREEAAPEE